jgi:hypothetical protein
VIPGTTPAAPDDRGEADPELAAALAAGDGTRIGLALLRARLLVPVVAVRTDGEADMAVPALVAADGRRALPVFSSVAGLLAWRPDGRPVPMPGARVLAAACAEGYDGVVLDVAGPVAHTVQGDGLRTLAAAAQALLDHPGAQVAAADGPVL